MKSPKEKYENDINYHKAVDAMEAAIHQGHFTPSEMREMAVLASIHYELRYGLNNYLQSVPLKVNDAFATLSEYRRQEKDEKETPHS